MSKQSDARERQGYEEKPTPCQCNTCEHFTSDKKTVSGYFSWSPPRVEEKNKRCALGGFAVKTTAICNEWKPRNA